MEGHWFDHTQEYAARQRGKTFGRMEYATLETLTLSPLPSWKDLPVETQRSLAAGLVAEIEADAAAQREQTGRPVLGVDAIRAQDPKGHPERPKKSPAPLFHAVTKAIRRELYEG